MASWSAIHLRQTAFRYEPGVAGSYLDRRIPLRRETPPGRYLYVVDSDGAIWLGLVGEDLKHSALVPPDSAVYCAEHLVLTQTGEVSLNCDSGHYMRDLPVLRSEEPAWRAAMSETIVEAGLISKSLDRGPNRIDA